MTITHREEGVNAVPELVSLGPDGVKQLYKNLEMNDETVNAVWVLYELIRVIFAEFFPDLLDLEKYGEDREGKDVLRPKWAFPDCAGLVAVCCVCAT